MALVDEAVSFLLKDHPGLKYLEDDFKAEGYMRLMTLLPNVRQKMTDSPEDTNPEAYIKLSVQSKCIRLFTRDHLGARSRESEEIPIRLSIDSIPLMSENDGSLLRQTIHDLCRTDRDRQIVSMMEAGHTQTEVAAVLEMPQQDVSRILKSLYTRLQEVLSE